MASVVSNDHPRSFGHFGKRKRFTCFIISDAYNLPCLEIYSFYPLVSLLQSLKICITLPFKFKCFAFYGIIVPHKCIFYPMCFLPFSFLFLGDNQVHVVGVSVSFPSEIKHVVVAGWDISEYICFMFWEQLFCQKFAILFAQIIHSNFEYAGRAIETVQNPIPEFHSFIAMNNYFWSRVISKDRIGENIGRLISLHLYFNGDNFLLFDIPNINAHIGHIIISLSQIGQKFVFPTPTKKHTFIFLCLLLRYVNPSIFIFA